MEELTNFDPKDVEENKVIASLSYISILFLVPLLVKKRKQVLRRTCKTGTYAVHFRSCSQYHSNNSNYRMDYRVDWWHSFVYSFFDCLYLRPSGKVLEDTSRLRNRPKL